MASATPDSASASLARRRFVDLAEHGKAQPPLTETALLVALEEYPKINIRNYMAQLHAFASVVADRVREAAAGSSEPLPVEQQFEIINQYLFGELGFRGDRDHYEDPRNSYLNQVIDRRLGIPITLSLVYLEVAAGTRLRLEGVGFPGHFLIKTRAEKPIRYLDPFHEGQEVSIEELRKRLREGGHESHGLVSSLKAINNRTILRRLLTNLKLTYLRRGDYGRALAAVERLLVMHPNAHDELRDLGLVCGSLGRYQRGIDAFEAYLNAVPAADDRKVIERQIDGFRYWNSRLN